MAEVTVTSDLELTYSSILSANLATLLEAESNIGLVRSMLRDSMQTLSVKVNTKCLEPKLATRTYVVSFVEYHDSVFRHFFGDLLCNFGVQKIMERVDDNIYERHLLRYSVNASTES